MIIVNFLNNNNRKFIGLEIERGKESEKKQKHNNKGSHLVYSE